MWNRSDEAIYLFGDILSDEASILAGSIRLGQEKWAT